MQQTERLRGFEEWGRTSCAREGVRDESGQAG